jgi:hypothetical protein
MLFALLISAKMLAAEMADYGLHYEECYLLLMKQKVNGTY